MWPRIPAVHGLLLVILAGQVAAAPDLENAVRMWMAKGRHGGMVAGVLTRDGKMASVPERNGRRITLVDLATNSAEGADDFGLSLVTGK